MECGDNRAVYNFVREDPQTYIKFLLTTRYSVCELCEGNDVSVLM